MSLSAKDVGQEGETMHLGPDLSRSESCFGETRPVAVLIVSLLLGRAKPKNYSVASTRGTTKPNCVPSPHTTFVSSEVRARGGRG